MHLEHRSYRTATCYSAQCHEELVRRQIGTQSGHPFYFVRLRTFVLGSVRSNRVGRDATARDQFMAVIIAKRDAVVVRNIAFAEFCCFRIVPDLAAPTVVHL